MSEDDIYQMLADIFERAPKLAQSQADIVLRDMYEDAFRIRRPGADLSTRDLLSIEMMPAEDPIWGSVLREQMELFALKEVGRIFNVSFDDFLQLPCYYADEMIQVATLRLEDEGNRKAEEYRGLMNDLSIKAQNQNKP